MRGGHEASFRVADRRGGGAGGGAAGLGGEHGGIARGDVDAGREGARATRGGVDAEAVVVGIVAEGGDGVGEASGAVGVALGKVDASALVRREETFPAVDGALDAHQRVRHAQRGALGLGRRRIRGVIRRGRGIRRRIGRGRLDFRRASVGRGADGRGEGALRTMPVDGGLARRVGVRPRQRSSAEETEKVSLTLGRGVALLHEATHRRAHPHPERRHAI